MLSLAVALWPFPMAAVVVGSWDVARGGESSLDHPQNAALKSALETSFPGLIVSPTFLLTGDFLDDVDILILGATTSSTTVITSLSASEQLALENFVKAGGSVFMGVENSSLPGGDASYESMIDPFDLDVTGDLFGSGVIPATITDMSHPMADGPFGTLTSFSIDRPGYFDSLGPYASVLATDSLGNPVLVEVPPGALGPGSGVVGVLADLTAFTPALLSVNAPLLLNATQYVLDTSHTHITPTGFIWPMLRADEDPDTEWLANNCGPSGAPLGGFESYDDDEYHIGHDFGAPEGTEVHAIADGEIFRCSVVGWGTNNKAYFIEHTLSDGTEFHALYGHVRPIDDSLNCESSQDVVPRRSVKAGEPFATIGPWPYGDHLHLGILPDLPLPPTNWGRMPCDASNPSNWPHANPLPANLNGFVDPIAWLTTEMPNLASATRSHLALASDVLHESAQMIDPAQTRIEPFQSGADDLRVALGWPGSSLRMRLLSPSQQVVADIDSSSPPIIVDVPAAATGQWSAEITGTDVPMPDYPYSLLVAAGGGIDLDLDGVLDDGDGSGTPGDAPCFGGATSGCDDNCVAVANPQQEDVDGDGAGDACDPSAAVCLPSFAAPVLVNSNARSGWTDEEPRLTTDSLGTWLVLWQSDDDIGGVYEHDQDVFAASSADDGETWTTATPVNTGADSDSASTQDAESVLATDGAGTWLAAWRNQGGSTGSDLDLLAAGSTDLGASWSSATSLNPNAASDMGFDGGVQVATDAAGSWIAVWTSDDPLGGSIGTDSDILTAVSMDQGATWSGPVALNSNATADTGSDAEPQIATDGTGTWLAIWESTDSLGGTIGEDFDILVARSTDAGATWSTPATLNGSETGVGRSDRRPHVAGDGTGDWVAVWETRDSLGGPLGTDQDLFVAHSTDDGLTWSTPEALNSHASIDSGSDNRPRIQRDGRVWATVWRSSDSLLGTIGTDTDILVAYSRDAGASWSAAAPLYDYAASDTGSDIRPQIASDGRGIWLAVFQSTDPLGGPPEGNYDILASTGVPSCCGDGVVTAREECDDANLSPADGCSPICEIEDGWLLHGTAQGGSVSLTVDGIVLQVFTLPGETAADVASNIAAAIASDPTLAATGVTAFAVGSRVVTTAAITRQVINDPGLVPPPIPGPSPGAIGLLVPVLLMAAWTLMRARRHRLS